MTLIARRLVALVALGCPLLFGGCVFLRLLELKRQLAEFDRHVAVDTSDGLKLTFKEPVLLDRDLGLLGLYPEMRRKLGVAERWDFRWVKDRAPGDVSGVAYEQTAAFVFVNRRLTTLMIPEQFFAFFPKSDLLDGLRAMGRAQVDRKRRVASSEVPQTAVGHTQPPLRAADLKAMVGAPVEARDGPAGPEWRYTFRAVSPGKQTDPIDLTFTLDPDSGVVRRIRGKLIIGSFDLSYPKAGSARASGSPRR